MKLSSPELTALDLVRYPQSGAGLDNIAKVLSELAARLQPDKLASRSGAFERAVVQRLGHLLTRLGHPQIAEPTFVALSARGSLAWVELDPKQAGDPDLSPPSSERDDRWRVIVLRPPEIDEGSRRTTPPPGAASCHGQASGGSSKIASSAVASCEMAAFGG